MQPDPPDYLCKLLSQWKTGLPARAILIDPDQLFEDICGAKDLSPSLVVRQLIRQYIVDDAYGRELPEWLVANVVRPD